MMNRLIYLCHPVSGDISANIARSKRWLKWIYDYFNVTVISQWMIDCEILDDGNPVERARGLERDKRLVLLADEVWLVGGKVSSGMREEATYAILARETPVWDFTSFGEEPPLGVPQRHVPFSWGLAKWRNAPTDFWTRMLRLGVVL